MNSCTLYIVEQILLFC